MRDKCGIKSEAKSQDLVSSIVILIPSNLVINCWARLWLF